jgi:Virulence factor BrkB/Putative Actinobacterial Holin-X, holin superfamily III
MNRAYDIKDARPWWRARLIAIGLTLALALLILTSFSLIVVGPTLAGHLASALGFGGLFEWAWRVLQWPLALFLASTAIGLVYYFAPDADQDWVWITPGALLATLLWVLASLALKQYVTNVTDYNVAYGAIGSVIVLLLWFYVSGLAILVGAELNAEIEHASPYGKAPGEKVPGQRRTIGTAAARAYRNKRHAFEALPDRELSRRSSPRSSPMAPESDRSLGEMFADLSRQTRTLVEQELQLARTELAGRVSHMRQGLLLLGVGALVASGGLLAGVAAVVLALIHAGLPPWGGALLGGVLIGGGGFLLIRAGLAALRADALVPRRTIESLKEDARWLSTQVR